MVMPNQTVLTPTDQMEEDMALPGNGVSPARGNGTPPAASASRCPRRLVLLLAEQDSEVAEVLGEQNGTEVSGKRIHADIQRFATEHRGSCVAAEWLGPLGWTRFLWCRKD